MNESNQTAWSLDIRIRLVLLFVWTMAVFTVQSWLVPLVVLALCIVLYVGTGCRLRILGYMTIGTSLMFAVIVAAAGIRFSPFGFSFEAALNALKACLRLYTVAAMSLLVSEASTTSDLMGGLRWLLSPLRRFRVPVEDLVMMLVIALGVIPEAARKFDMIKMAQNARGARIGLDRNPVRRVLSFVVLFIPLLVALFRHADDLADAMTVKRYRGGVGRDVPMAKLGMRDTAIMCLGLVFALVVCLTM